MSQESFTVKLTKNTSFAFDDCEDFYSYVFPLLNFGPKEKEYGFLKLLTKNAFALELIEQDFNINLMLNEPIEE